MDLNKNKSNSQLLYWFFVCFCICSMYHNFSMYMQRQEQMTMGGCATTSSLRKIEFVRCVRLTFVFCCVYLNDDCAFSLFGHVRLRYIRTSMMYLVKFCYFATCTYHNLTNHPFLKIVYCALWFCFASLHKIWSLHTKNVCDFYNDFCSCFFVVAFFRYVHNSGGWIYVLFDNCLYDDIWYIRPRFTKPFCFYFKMELLQNFVPYF